MNEPIKKAEEAIREQEELDVTVQKSAKMVADYYKTLTNNGLSEISAMSLTAMWMMITFNQGEK